MGAKLNTKAGTYEASPGAGTYNPPTKVIESPGKTFSKKLYSSHYKGMLGTGPAAYNVDKKKTQNFSYSMGGKLQDLAFKTANFAPGPGTHEPSIHNGSPNTKFGSGQRSSLDGGKETLGKPGPGQYQGSVDGIKNRSPKFGFGSGKLADMVSRLSVPGPGTYAAKAILGMDGPSKTMASTLAFEPTRKE